MTDDPVAVEAQEAIEEINKITPMSWISESLIELINARMILAYHAGREAGMLDVRKVIDDQA
jgi:hypothetical protein